MNNWIYFATEEKASLASTLETVINTQFLWRSAFNKNGARIANVGGIKEGDNILLAWRHSGVLRTAYLRCRVAAPLSPRAPGLVIDKLADPDAKVLSAAGYPKNAAGEVEGIRLDEILECCFQVKGQYGGNNAIHELTIEDAAQVATASTIPPGIFTKAVSRMTESATRKESAAPLAARTAPGVDRFEIDTITSHRAFDAYVMVDWSSSSSPATGCGFRGKANGIPG